MKKYIILLVLSIFCFAACNKKEPFYKFKEKTKEYIVFFNNGSWWEYQKEGATDSFRWEVINCSLDIFDYGGSKGDYFYAYVDYNNDFSEFRHESYAESKNDKSISRWGEIISDDLTIKGSGNLPLEDSIEVNGVIYNSVFHLYFENPYIYKDIWIAPNVGVIKIRYSDDQVYLLKSYNIEKL